MNLENKISKAINILSIDVDSHLQKLASNTYRSPDHYPVELIRSALKRKANTIRIDIKADRVNIYDNGSGITPHQLRMLYELYVSSQPTTVRENAIENFLTNEGIGLLAIFTPSPERILIENASIHEKKCINIQSGKIQESNNCTIKSGTSITLFRKKNNWKQEEKILTDYCKSVQEEIILNGNPIKKEPILSNSFVSINLKNSNNINNTWVGIPLFGDVCRIWLLDQRIPWYFATISPWKGFVFEAAIEYRGKLTESVLDHISHGALKLYKWLIKRYNTYQPNYQSRVEELIFKHYRLTSNPQLINQFSPFKTLNSPEGMNLSQIKQEIDNINLYAIPLNENPSHYNVCNKTVLLLSRSQTDFLLNQLKIPIIFLTPIPRKKFQFKDFFYSFTKKCLKLMTRMRISKRKILNNQELTHEEKIFLKTLNQYLLGNNGFPSDFFQKIKIKPILVDNRGFVPSIIIKENKFENVSLSLLIMRKHPIVRKAVYALQIDPGNIELIAPVFLSL